jgi:hypothetical protein
VVGSVDQGVYACPDGQLFQQKTYPANVYPTQVVVQDLDGDGVLDLALANLHAGRAGQDLGMADLNAGRASVLLGKGDGTFLLKGSHLSGAYQGVMPCPLPGLAVASITPGSTPDLFFADCGSSILSQQPDGQGGWDYLDNNQSSYDGGNPTQVVAQDLNGDGVTDLVVNTASDMVRVLLGPAYDKSTDLAQGDHPLAVAAARVTGAGTPDLLLATEQGQVLVLPARGDGTFLLPGQSFQVGPMPVAVTAADLTGGGLLDLVTVNQGNNTVSVLLNGAKGSAFSPQLTRTFATGNSPVSLAVADMDGDGRPDLLIVDQNDNTVSLLYGIGDGTFQPRTCYHAGTYPTSVAAADLDGDGRCDFVVTSQDPTAESDIVSVFLNTGPAGAQHACNP